MKHVNLWYLAEFLLEWQVFKTKVLGKKNILCSINFFPKNHDLWDNVEKYGRARHNTDDSIIQHREDTVCMSDN
jgi:hypothetical protein